MLFFARILDVYDEEFADVLTGRNGDADYASSPEFHRFIVPKAHYWRTVRETTSNVGHTLQEAMRANEKAKLNTLAGPFGDAFWRDSNLFSDEASCSATGGR